MMKNKWILILLVSLASGSTYLPALAYGQFNAWQQTEEKCVAPTNINYVISPDRKQVTFAWQAYPTSAPIINYQINDYANIPLWKSFTSEEHCFSSPLTGATGKFIYYFYSRCADGFSPAYKFQIIVT